MRVLVSGGSGCGKSTFAERVACALPAPRVYLATMQPFGRDGAERVRRHRAMRAGKGFLTVERYADYEGLSLARELDGRGVGGEALAGGTVLLECLGNVVANVQFGLEGSCGDGEASRASVDVAARTVGAVEALERQCAHVVVVTNEVGSDGIAYPDETRAYVRALGSANCRLAAGADAVYEVAAGIARAVRAPREAPWER